MNKKYEYSIYIFLHMGDHLQKILDSKYKKNEQTGAIYQKYLDKYKDDPDDLEKKMLFTGLMKIEGTPNQGQHIKNALDYGTEFYEDDIDFYDKNDERNRIEMEEKLLKKRHEQFEQLKQPYKVKTVEYMQQIVDKSLHPEEDDITNILEQEDTSVDNPKLKNGKNFLSSFIESASDKIKYTKETLKTIAKFIITIISLFLRWLFELFYNLTKTNPNNKVDVIAELTTFMTKLKEYTFNFSNEEETDAEIPESELGGSKSSRKKKGGGYDEIKSSIMNFLSNNIKTVINMTFLRNGDIENVSEEDKQGAENFINGIVTKLGFPETTVPEFSKMFADAITKILPNLKSQDGITEKGGGLNKKRKTYRKYKSIRRTRRQIKNKKVEIRGGTRVRTGLLSNQSSVVVKEPVTSIEEIKKEIEEKSNIPVDQRQLIFSDSRTDDDGDENIKDDHSALLDVLHHLNIRFEDARQIANEDDFTLKMFIIFCSRTVDEEILKTSIYSMIDNEGDMEMSQAEFFDKMQGYVSYWSACKFSMLIGSTVYGISPTQNAPLSKDELRKKRLSAFSKGGGQKDEDDFDTPIKPEYARLKCSEIRKFQKTLGIKLLDDEINKGTIVSSISNSINGINLIDFEKPEKKGKKANKYDEDKLKKLEMLKKIAGHFNVTLPSHIKKFVKVSIVDGAKSAELKDFFETLKKSLKEKIAGLYTKAVGESSPTSAESTGKTTGNSSTANFLDIVGKEVTRPFTKEETEANQAAQEDSKSTLEVQMKTNLQLFYSWGGWFGSTFCDSIKVIFESYNIRTPPFIGKKNVKQNMLRVMRDNLNTIDATLNKAIDIIDGLIEKEKEEDAKKKLNNQKEILNELKKTNQTNKEHFYELLKDGFGIDITEKPFKEERLNIHFDTIITTYDTEEGGEEKKTIYYTTNDKLMKLIEDQWSFTFTNFSVKNIEDVNITLNKFVIEWDDDTRKLYNFSEGIHTAAQSTTGSLLDSLLSQDQDELINISVEQISNISIALKQSFPTLRKFHFKTRTYTVEELVGYNAEFLPMGSSDDIIINDYSDYIANEDDKRLVDMYIEVDANKKYKFKEGVSDNDKQKVITNIKTEIIIERIYRHITNKSPTHIGFKILINIAIAFACYWLFTTVLSVILTTILSQITNLIVVTVLKTTSLGVGGVNAVDSGNAFKVALKAVQEAAALAYSNTVEIPGIKRFVDGINFMPIKFGQKVWELIKWISLVCGLTNFLWKIFTAEGKIETLGGAYDVLAKNSEDIVTIVNKKSIDAYIVRTRIQKVIDDVEKLLSQIKIHKHTSFGSSYDKDIKALINYVKTAEKNQIFNERDRILLFDAIKSGLGIETKPDEIITSIGKIETIIAQKISESWSYAYTVEDADKLKKALNSFADNLLSKRKEYYVPILDAIEPPDSIKLYSQPACAAIAGHKFYKLEAVGLPEDLGSDLSLNSSNVKVDLIKLPEKDSAIFKGVCLVPEEYQKIQTALNNINEAQDLLEKQIEEDKKAILNVRGNAAPNLTIEVPNKTPSWYANLNMANVAGAGAQGAAIGIGAYAGLTVAVAAGVLTAPFAVGLAALAGTGAIITSLYSSSKQNAQEQDIVNLFVDKIVVPLTVINIGMVSIALGSMPLEWMYGSKKIKRGIKYKSFKLIGGDVIMNAGKQGTVYEKISYVIFNLEILKTFGNIVSSSVWYKIGKVKEVIGITRSIFYLGQLIIFYFQGKSSENNPISKVAIATVASVPAIVETFKKIYNNEPAAVAAAPAPAPAPAAPAQAPAQAAALAAAAAEARAAAQQSQLVYDNSPNLYEADTINVKEIDNETYEYKKLMYHTTEVCYSRQPDPSENMFYNIAFSKGDNTNLYTIKQDRKTDNPLAYGPTYLQPGSIGQIVRSGGNNKSRKLKFKNIRNKSRKARVINRMGVKYINNVRSGFKELFYKKRMIKKDSLAKRNARKLKKKTQKRVRKMNKRKTIRRR
jgi:hypothetical protein